MAYCHQSELNNLPSFCLGFQFFFWSLFAIVLVGYNDDAIVVNVVGVLIVVTKIKSNLFDLD